MPCSGQVCLGLDTQLQLHAVNDLIYWSIEILTLHVVRAGSQSVALGIPNSTFRYVESSLALSAAITHAIFS